LPLLAIVSNQLDLFAILNEWKMTEEIKAAAANNSIVLNRKLHGSDLLAGFIENVVDPAITDFKRQEIRGHTNSRLRQCSQGRQEN
jgi:hypothetical protein